MRSIPGTNIISILENDFNHLVEGRVESIGSGLPTTAGTYAFGARIVETSTGVSYINTGTATLPVWNRLGSSAVVDPQNMQLAINTLAPADIIATAAGTLGHANGLIMAPAAPAGFVNVWHRTIVSYTFGVAAYTGGGNTTVAIGAGGATLSGLIATTTLWQNASSIIQEFVPLSTVAFPITTATSINLKTASAVTNPGTATGTAKVYTWYSVVAI